MDYEKAYKESVEKLRYKITDNNGNIDYQAIVNVDELQDIFPELKESEDEKHRKWIIAYLNDEFLCADELTKPKLQTAIAWLEKQVKYPQFTFDDVLALQCCMEIVKKVQKDEGWYKQLQSLHGRVYDACHLENQEEEQE